MPEFLTEFLQVGQTVDIDDDTQGLCLFDLVEAYSVGGIQHPFRREAGMEG